MTTFFIVFGSIAAFATIIGILDLIARPPAWLRRLQDRRRTSARSTGDESKC